MFLYLEDDFESYVGKLLDMNFINLFMSKYGGRIVDNVYQPVLGLYCNASCILYDIFEGAKLTPYFNRDYIWNLFINNIHIETIIVEDIDIKPMNFNVFLW